MRFLYFADPMCSWCWGFSPVMRAVADAHTLPVQVVMGGLRPGTTEPMSPAMAQDIRGHWEHVHEASGQPFDFSFFDRDGFVYDTEPACRAVVAMRTLHEAAGGCEPLDALAAVQAAFYRDNRDVTDSGVLADIAVENGFDREAFSEAYQEVAASTQADFALSLRLGVRGFPTLVGDDGSRLIALTTGYRPAEALVPIVRDWIAEGGPVNDA